MSNIAREVIKPKTEGIFRTVFLYTGQGESTLLVIPDGQNYKYLLVDSNLDSENGGIDIVKLLQDLLDNELDVFLNTHPHIDHLSGIKDVFEKVGIKEIWHSGHKPGGEHKDCYTDFKNIMDKVSEDKIYLLKGSKEENKLDDKKYQLGDINFNVLAPAEYVIDEIEDEKPEVRYERIHEQCGVIRFSYGEDPGRILLTGDSDITAWKKHITDYHEARLSSNVLSASHHGSRTFFKKKEEDEKPYTTHIEKICATYLIISAPKQEESKHKHPHDDAIEIYKTFIDEDNIFHLGNVNSFRRCIIVDINSSGEIAVEVDEELINAYRFNGGKSTEGHIVINKDYSRLRTTLDNKPMGCL